MEKSRSNATLLFVASPRIELGSGASETLILSIVLRGQEQKSKVQGSKNNKNPFGFCLLVFGFFYLINPPALPANIFTAMASNITPKNFRTASKPAGPSNFSMYCNDFNTTNTTIRLKSIAISITRSE